MIWSNFIKNHLQKKKDFHSYLKMKDICNAYYRHSKRVCKEVEIKYLREYHDLYVQGNTLMYWTTFEIYVLTYSNLILQSFFQFLN